MQRRYEYLYGQELQDLIAREPIAWVPLGILERHGEHLPYGLDGLKAHGVCLYLANRLGGCVLPATHLSGVHPPFFGDDLERYRQARKELGDFYLRPDTFRMLLEDTVDGLSNLGFTTIVLYTGHYPSLQREIIEGVAARGPMEGGARVIGFAEPYARPGKGGHAGLAETSLHMVLGGEVRLDAVRPKHAGKLGFFPAADPPGPSTVEEGQVWLDAIEAWFIEKLAGGAA